MKENEITNSAFLEFLSCKTASLQTMAKHIIEQSDQCVEVNRPYFGSIHMEATKIEELLDAYGAKNNERWHIFRKTVASMKLFSNVIYICLHIKYSIHSYSLLDIEEDFPAATDDVLNSLYKSVLSIAKDLLQCARHCGITIYSYEEKRAMGDKLPKGKLKNDRQGSIVEKPEKNITYLVSKFLNLSEEIKQLEIYRVAEPAEYADSIPNIVSEEKIRWIENKFHNLQSLYDTNISDSNLESVDNNLPILRGHASLIFHLFEVATELCHYYERHLLCWNTPPEAPFKAPICREMLLKILFEYALKFSESYLIAFHDLSQDILREYTEESWVRLPIPNYRGFHIRPSTLVSRIVVHYGSQVFIEFEGRRFDASKPLEIFRINEKINSLKRRNIASKISELDYFSDASPVNERNYRQLLQKVFFRLLEEKSIVMYESNFSFDDMKFDHGESLLEISRKAVSRYLALGRIDITNDMTVVFHGDKRALNDLKILADCGYGEDNYGNNTLLPRELAYLQR